MTRREKMVFDIEKHEENKLKFLGALYEIAQEHITAHKDTSDPVEVVEKEQIIGQRAGLTRQEAERISSELLRKDFLGQPYMSDDNDGPPLHLTQCGLETIEQHLYEKSFLSKRRKFVSFAREGGIRFSKQALAWIGSIIAAVIAGLALKEQIIAWLKLQLGI